MAYPIITIIGGGQLGRMLTQEAQKLGFQVNILDQDPDCSAGQVSDGLVLGDIFDTDIIEDIAPSTNFWTFEIEHLDCDQLDFLVKKFSLKINPFISTLRIINDKFHQKEFLRTHGIPVADFGLVNSLSNDLDKKISDLPPFPFITKTHRGGFDGRGNMIVKNQKDLENAIDKFGLDNIYWESLVDFGLEVSVIVVKGEFQTSLYEVTENIHKDNICVRSITPARISEDSKTQAGELALRIVDKLEGRGVFTVEFFVTRDGKLIVNEIAPRVHNSGHWTMNGSSTSQFENHIRAITGLNLGNTAMTHPYSVMVNILGTKKGEVKLEALHNLLEIPNLHLHLYGKNPVKKARKMGHINLVGDNLEALLKLADEVEGRVRV